MRRYADPCRLAARDAVRATGREAVLRRDLIELGRDLIETVQQLSPLRYLVVFEGRDGIGDGLVDLTEQLYRPVDELAVFVRRGG